MGDRETICILTAIYTCCSAPASLLPARAAEYVSLNDSKPRLLAFGIICCMAITSIAVGLYYHKVVFFPVTTYNYLRGHMEVCGRDNTYCTELMTINDQAAPGDRVYQASYYSYWLRPDLLQCMRTMNDSFIESSNNIWLSLYHQGFRFLLIDKMTHGYFFDRLKLANPPNWLNVTPLIQNQTIEVYRLDANNPPSPPSAICQNRSGSSVWEVVTP